MSEQKQKILLCGDVEGRFDTLYKRVQSITSKSGPFDLLLCVGNFFGINNSQFDAYKIGDKKVPIPTYILGPNKEDQLSFYPPNESDCELCPNVYYLGKRGIYTDFHGVKIAYVSGVTAETESAYNYGLKEIQELCDLCLRGNPSFRGVDILITSQWPGGIIEETKRVNVLESSCCDMLSYLCMKIKPRYIVSGLEGVFYERLPFRCPVLGDNDSTMETVTRFIGLARVGNAEKAKWIYALNLTPIDKMRVSELMQKTIDETPCPFNFMELESKIFKTKRKTAETAQYFYDMSTADENQTKRKPKRQKIEFDQSKCWFCLASPSVEKHLIVSVGNSTYLALAKGGLVEEHFLICPIEHQQSSLTLSDETLAEIEQFKESLTKFYKRKSQIPVFFERNYKTSHMQLQAVPIPQNAEKELKEIFMDEAEGNGLKLDVLESHNRLDQVLKQRVPYFAVELPDGQVLYTKVFVSTNFPLNFAREVLASGPLLNMMDRSDWRNCIVIKDEEEKLVQKIRTDYEPFDFTM